LPVGWAPMPMMLAALVAVLEQEERTDAADGDGW
jgi:hypothetical protein